MAALILGDNIFYGDNLRALLRDSSQQPRGATVFACWVDDPERYGVIEFDAAHRPLRIVEKPKAPKSNYAVSGLYFYDERVVDIARELRPSARGELEITDVNNWYVGGGQMEADTVDGFWGDAGESIDAYYEVNDFVRRNGVNG